MFRNASALGPMVRRLRAETDINPADAPPNRPFYLMPKFETDIARVC
ncbi:hypothetical protein ACVW1B_003660 [Bradyrhizobium sp. USDA 4502]